MHRTLSLFTGAGGLDLGLRVAGFEAAVAVECDSAAALTLESPANERWWHSTALLTDPVEDISSRRLLRAGGLRKRRVALLVGGPPCQPFSKSGYWHSGDARRLDDPRANTLREYLRVLEDALPEVFLLENVPGLAFSEKDDGLQLLRKEIQAINERNRTLYTISAARLNAVEFGVPQARERVIIIGHRGGKNFQFPKPTHQKPSSVDMSNGALPVLSRQTLEGLEPCSTAWDAIGHLESADDPALAARGKWARLLPSIPEGHNYLFHTARGRGEEIFGWRRRYWSMLLKLAKSRPSWTLTAQPGPAIGPFHWENRRLSALELCALQTYPEGYVVEGTLGLAYRQLGNAVPSALAEVLGLEIRRQLFGETGVVTKASLLPKRREPIPPPEPVTAVPAEYRSLIGKQEAHPGTGGGPGAQRRTAL
jgi:DNA (cytosine-5)-methyltransferase 1